MRCRGALAVLGLALALALAGCSPADHGQSTASPTPDGGAAPGPGTVVPIGAPTVIAKNLDVPWSMVRLASGSTLVSERATALIKEIQTDGTLRIVGKVPGVVPNDEAGLLGLAVQARDQGWLYADESTASDNRVIRMRLNGGPGSYSLGAAHVIFAGLPTAGNHDGGRLEFGPDGDLYVTAGDATQRERAQDLDYLGGKILRLEPDGSIPDDNPFPGSPVYSYGHRNPQGIAWDDSGRMWAAEFGQDTWDELNIIEPGKNYGWPIVEGIGNDARFVNPVKQWATSVASPSGLLWTHGTLFLAALRGERLWVIDPTATPVRATAWFTGDFGRLRDVINGPDGTIWILTNNTARGAPKAGDDRILQVRIGTAGNG